MEKQYSGLCPTCGKPDCSCGVEKKVINRYILSGMGTVYKEGKLMFLGEIVDELNKLSERKDKLQQENKDINESLTASYLSGRYDNKKELEQLKKKNNILLEALEDISRQANVQDWFLPIIEDAIEKLEKHNKD